MEYILELKKIRKTFGNIVANDDIDMKVRKGSVHALVGENGAGKSTLMNIITAFHKPDSGNIILNGRKIVLKDTMDATKHGIGMVYQEFMLFDELTVLENIIMGFEQKKWFFIDKNTSEKKILEICNKYNFNIPLHEKIRNLPVALLQQVEIVKVLYRGADIIILDEPTSVLTPQGIEGLFNAIRFLKKQGKTIIIITHKLTEVFEIADYITVLKNGKVSGNVLPSEIDENKLANLMVGREVILQLQKLPCKVGKLTLEIENLTVTDGHGAERLKSINLKVRAGEIVGIAGVAGSGQQQLAESIIGLISPEKTSKIMFCGQNLDNRSISERRCMGISYISQDRIGEGVNINANIWENAIMGYHIVHGFGKKVLLNRQKINNYTLEIIKKYSVKVGNQETRISSLSGGNIQKLIVGREFSMASRLLIIQNPTRGIDVGTIEFIRTRIVELAASGIAVLLISYELNEVMQLADRMLVMYNGNITDGGKYGELNETEIGLLMAGGVLN